MRIFHLSFVALALLCGRGFAASTNDPSPRAPVQWIAPSAGARTVVDFDRGWRFSKGDFASAAVPAFDDSAWRRLDLPHDWSIEGPFSPELASGTGYAPGGIGWYRRHFRLDAAATNRLIAIEFDGVYDHSQVWINGHFVGGRPYGYSSFACDLTPFLKSDEADNVVAVRVDHTRYADSRWYTGSGIYRHVRLRLTNRLRVAQWGAFVTTPKVEEHAAEVQVETTVENDTGAAVEFALESDLLAPDGREAGRARTTARVGNATNTVIVQNITVSRPRLWSPDTPLLYTLRSRLSNGRAVADEVATPFGIRALQLDADRGFFLNGVSMKLKGVCLHHDAGCLGAAVPAHVWERRLRALKEIGVNAIRTSHNPPAPELLDLCDRLGFLVKDEAFDEFTPAKNKWIAGWNSATPGRFGYAENFTEWSQRDIQDLVRRDRNHPSVILWSIGNEIDYANDPFSHPILGDEYRPENPPAENLVKLARPLIEAVKQLDRTRPVTAALANVAMSDAVGLGKMLDAVGYNYQESRYPSDHEKFPGRIIFGSENGHLYANWAVVLTNDYVCGQFLWTGIDYLGEANRWPNRANGAGLLDLCGYKKPLAWFRQSLWSDQPMVYIYCALGDGGRRGRIRGEESWNWPSNSTVTVRCFTTCPTVQLRLNDQIIGTKRGADATGGGLTWEVPFESGVLTAIGCDGDKALCEFSLKTAGPPSRIELIPEKTQLSAAAGDVCHVEFRVVDAQGVRVLDATKEVTFELDGPAEILGIGNADLANSEDCKGKTHLVFQGRGLVILQAKSVVGIATLTATSPGLEPETVAFEW